MNTEISTFFDSLAYSWDNLEEADENIKLYLLQKIDIKKGDKVIDIACGTGAITKYIYYFSQNNIDCIDISNNMINVAKNKYKDLNYANFKCEDFLELQSENTYDVAIIYNAYPHFIDVEAFASKLNGVLKKGGKFAILHSLTLDNLKKCHESLNDSLSREIKDLDFESSLFKKYFKIIACKEEENCFYIIGKKL